LFVSEVNATVGCGGRNGRGKAIDDLRKREVVFHDVSRCAIKAVAESTSPPIEIYRIRVIAAVDVKVFLIYHIGDLTAIGIY
jgi:hypothetical protein